MNVIYYINNSNKRAMTLHDVTRKGLSRVGIKMISKVQTQYRGEVEADVAIFYGLSGNLDRIRKDYIEAGKTAILFDLGYWGRHDGGRLNGYHRIAINGLHGVPFFSDLPVSDKRIRRFKLELKPFKKVGEHILICGQSAKAAGIYGLEPEEWELKVIAKLKNCTDREIWYRPKLSWPGRRPIDGTVYCELDTIPAAKKSWMVISHHSNSCVHALEMGKPIYLDDGIASILSTPNLEDIENPFYPEEQTRDLFIKQVGYCQWNVREIASGEMFRFLSEYGVFQ